uniref:Uncharacterized protein n=1 Tax=Timema bartmani TaxID=61472 RepID=A0A7R9F6U4_9NEOP|nr:unnamed protein product [Timema bartmani]
MNSSEEQPRQQDQEQQKQKQLPLLARINLPLIWAQLECGVRIEDLQEKRFHEASVLLNDYFIQDETLCKASKLAEEPVSVESFLETVQFWLRDKTSLCAIDVDSDAMVGLLITRVVSYLEHARDLKQSKLGHRNTVQNQMKPKIERRSDGIISDEGEIWEENGIMVWGLDH